LAAPYRAGLRLGLFQHQDKKAQALIVQPIFVNTLASGPQIADLALKYRLPTISDGDNFGAWQRW